MADKAVLFDATKCIACRACQVACKQWNELPAESTSNRGSYENPADLSHQTWLKIQFKEVEQGGQIKWLFSRRGCVHCTDAACIKVCPPHALYKNEFGTVSYDRDICTGCGYCADFCPFDVPRLNGNRITGIAKMDKCVFCTQPGLNRISAGYGPACVKTCPTEALAFGDRDKLVTEGRQRVEALKAKGLSNSYLYGDKELRGLHVMFVLDNSPQAYGLPASPEVPPLAVAWKNVIQPVGWTVGALTLLGLALNYVVAREAKIAHDLPARKED